MFKEALDLPNSEKGLVLRSQDFLIREGRGVPFPEGRGESGTEWYKTKPDYLMLPSRERRKVTRCRFVMLPGHSTDHRALVTLMHTGEKGNITAYRKKMQQCPLRIPRGRMSSDEKKFETLRRAVELQQARDRPDNS